MSEQRPLHILAIEDNPGDAFLIRFYLEEIDPEGYVIHDAGSLAKGLELLESESIDVILLDLHLPDASGLGILDTVVEFRPDIPVVVMTGLSDEKTGENAVSKGAQDFLVKGRFDGAILDSSIKYASKRSDLNKQFNQINDETSLLNEVLDAMMISQNIGFVLYWKENNRYEASRHLQAVFSLSESHYSPEEANKALFPDIDLANGVLAPLNKEGTVGPISFILSGKQCTLKAVSHGIGAVLFIAYEE